MLFQRHELPHLVCQKHEHLLESSGVSVARRAASTGLVLPLEDLSAFDLNPRPRPTRGLSKRDGMMIAEALIDPQGTT